jgi:tripartite-type tricarboxylate transporter receptor subunit TctC
MNPESGDEMNASTRRHALKLLAATGLAPTLPAFAAGDWPNRSVRMLVGFPPGGATDYVARQMTAAFNASVAQQFVVDNKPGAVGMLASIEAARAPADGYTFLFPLDSHAYLHLTNKKLPYDTFTAFDYLSLLVTLPQVIVVPSNSPYKTFKDLLAGMKQSTLAYGTTGVASVAHVSVLKMCFAEKLNATHIPYKGAAPMVTDLIGGQLPFGSAGLSVAMPFLKAGSLRALAVSSLQRSPLMPEVPAMAETVPGHEVISWVGLAAPAKTPADVRQKMLTASHAALQTPALRKTLEENSFTVVASGPEEFAQRIRQDADSVKTLMDKGILVVD